MPRSSPRSRSIAEFPAEPAFWLVAEAAGDVVETVDELAVRQGLDGTGGVGCPGDGRCRSHRGVPAR